MEKSEGVEEKSQNGFNFLANMTEKGWEFDYFRIDVNLNGRNK
jgi:hypothetical protein